MVDETVENIAVLSTTLSTKGSITGLVEETVENIGVLSTTLSTKASKTGLVEETVKSIGVLSTTLSTTLDCTINIITVKKREVTEFLLELPWLFVMFTTLCKLDLVCEVV